MPENSATIPTLAPEIVAFLGRNKLDDSYPANAQIWFTGLINNLLLLCNGSRHPLVVGVNGCQGSGKTTLCDYLATVLGHEHKLQVVSLSLDDFYLTRTERQHLAADIHPLFETRGVPGTHDVELALETVRNLCDLQPGGECQVPRFDKSCDDRAAKEKFTRIDTPPDIILLEGWCLGSRPQPDTDLQKPVNLLEQQEDPDGIWRSYVNHQLAENYQPLFNRVQLWVMLQAPSFDSVYHWRLEQEQKLADLTAADNNKNCHIMDDQQIARFIQFYQRVTEHTLATLPDQVHHLYRLNESRDIIRHCCPRDVQL